MDAVSRPGLCGMPAELLHRILAEFHNVSHETFRSLRQTCRRLVVSANEYLFHRIRLSSLRRDRDHFLNIAGAAHLACHVRVLVWEEISFDGTIATNGPWSTLTEEYPDLATHLKEILWLPMLRPQADFSGVVEVAEFQSAFEKALMAMPNLRSLASEQMHPYRRLLPSRFSTGLKGYYPIPAHHLQRITHPKVDDTDVLFNAGFFAFLVPAMSNLTQRRAEGLDVPFITHLQVYFEQDRCLKDLWPVASPYPYSATSMTNNPFSSMTHIDICMSGPWRRYMPNDSTNDEDTITERNKRRFSQIQSRILGILQSAAASVTHLHLCRQNTWDDWGSPGRSILRSLPHMPRLRALHLDGIYHDDTLMQPPYDRPVGTDEERATGYKESAFVKFVREHQASLRELHVKGTPVTFDMLVDMRATIPGLQLERFVALPFGLHGNHQVAQTYVSENDVLEFVHNKVSTISEMPTVFFHEGVKTKMELTTADMDDDELEMSTATDMDRHLPLWSRCRPRLGIPDPADDVEEIAEERTWTDRWGRSQEVGEKHELWDDVDEQLNDQMGREIVGHSEDDGSQQVLPERQPKTRDEDALSMPWGDRDDQTWDADLGLWRIYPDPWYRYGTDPPVPAEDTTEVVFGMDPLDLDHNKENDVTIQHCANQGVDGMRLVECSATATPGDADDPEGNGRASARKWVVGERFDDVTSAKCRREHDSHLRRQQQDAGWIYARDEHGKVYFRPADSTGNAHDHKRRDSSSGHGGDRGNSNNDHPTEIWRFDHRDVEHAYGTEPLDYWSDWEGSQAGDTYEATPFGPRLWDFANPTTSHQKKMTLDLISADDIRSEDTAGVFEGWVQYHEADEVLPGLEGIWRGLPGPLVTGEDVPRPGDADASYDMPMYLGGPA